MSGLVINLSEAKEEEISHSQLDEEKIQNVEVETKIKTSSLDEEEVAEMFSRVKSDFLEEKKERDDIYQEEEEESKEKPPIDENVVRMSFPMSSQADEEEEGEGSSTRGELKIRKYFPEGVVLSFEHIMVSFNYPIVPISTLTDLDESYKIPFTVNPDVGGVWQWVDTQTIEWRTKSKLPKSTTFEITVPKGIKSLNGCTLTEELKWKFSTPSVGFIGMFPEKRRGIISYLDPSTPFLLEFDQKIDKNEVMKRLKFHSVEEKSEKSEPITPKLVAMDLKKVKKHTSKRGYSYGGRNFKKSIPEHCVCFRTEEPLPEGRMIKLTLSAGFPSLEGPNLTLKDQSRVTDSTYKSLKVISYAPGSKVVSSGSDGYFYVRFTNGLNEKDFEAERDVIVDPPIENLKVVITKKNNEYVKDIIKITGDMKDGTEYTITYKETIKDVYGQRMKESQTLTFQVSSPKPGEKKEEKKKEIDASKFTALDFMSMFNGSNKNKKKRKKYLKSFYPMRDMGRGGKNFGGMFVYDIATTTGGKSVVYDVMTLPEVTKIRVYVYQVEAYEVMKSLVVGGKGFNIRSEYAKEFQKQNKKKKKKEQEEVEGEKEEEEEEEETTKLEQEVIKKKEEKKKTKKDYYPYTVQQRVNCGKKVLDEIIEVGSSITSTTTTTTQKVEEYNLTRIDLTKYLQYSNNNNNNDEKEEEEEGRYCFGQLIVYVEVEESVWEKIYSLDPEEEEEEEEEDDDDDDDDEEDEEEKEGEEEKEKKFKDIKEVVRPYVMNWVQVTNLSINVSKSYGHETHLFCTHLEDGSSVGAGIEFSVVKPKKSVKEVLYQKEEDEEEILCSVRGDDDGFASLDMRRMYKGILVAKKGNGDSCFITDYPGIRKGYGSGNSNVEKVLFWIINDRGLYRPKEKVSIKGIIRKVSPRFKEEGINAPGRVVEIVKEGTKVDWIFKDPRGKEKAKGTVKTNKFGSFFLEIEIPEDVNLGNAIVEFKTSVLEKVSSMTTHSFRIEEFRTPSFKASAEVVSGTGPFVSGGKAIVEGKADYYSGRGLGGAKVTWEVWKKPNRYIPKGFRGYSFYRTFHDCLFGPDKDESRVGTVSGTTGVNGTHRLCLDFKKKVSSKGRRGSSEEPVLVTCVMTVQDMSRQSMQAVTSFIAHPCTCYVGVKMRRFSVARVGSTYDLDVVVVDPEGNLVPDMDIEMTILNNKIKGEGVQSSRFGRETYYRRGKEKLKSSSTKPTHIKLYLYESGLHYFHLKVRNNEGVLQNECVARLFVVGEKLDEKSDRKYGMHGLGWIPGCSNVGYHGDFIVRRSHINSRYDGYNVGLVGNKKEFEVGDEAKILVTSPLDSPVHGILYVVSGAVCDKQSFTINDKDTHSAVVTFLIREEHLPSAKIHVTLTGSDDRVDMIQYHEQQKNKREEEKKPSKKKKKDIEEEDEEEVEGEEEEEEEEKKEEIPKKPVICSGELMLSVSDPKKDLKVKVTPEKKLLRPSEESKVFVEVTCPKDPKFSAGEGETAVTVIIVDEAVLSKSKHEIAHPLDTFLDSRLFSFTEVEERDLREFMVMIGRGWTMKKEESVGYGRPMCGKRGRGSPRLSVRIDFNPLALFVSDVLTDTNGKVVIPFKLPDSLTSYRIWAIAQNVRDGRIFGLGQSSLLADIPLSVRTALPRFLNFGDEPKFSVIIPNTTTEKIEVKVGVRVTKLRLFSSPDGDPSIHHPPPSSGLLVEIPPYQRAELQFPLRTHHSGKCRFQAIAMLQKKKEDTGPEMYDVVEESLEICDPSTTETFAIHGEMTGDSSAIQPITIPSENDVFPNFGSLSITSSSTILQSLTDAFLYVYNYKFSCLEQLCSRMIGILALRSFLQEFNVPNLPTKKEMATVLKHGKEKIKKSQDPDDGMFGFWGYTLVVDAGGRRGRGGRKRGRKRTIKKVIKKDVYLSLFVLYTMNICNEYGLGISSYDTRKTSTFGRKLFLSGYKKLCLMKKKREKQQQQQQKEEEEEEEEGEQKEEQKQKQEEDPFFPKGYHETAKFTCYAFALFIFTKQMFGGSLLGAKQKKKEQKKQKTEQQIHNLKKIGSISETIYSEIKYLEEVIEDENTKTTDISIIETKAWLLYCIHVCHKLLQELELEEEKEKKEKEKEKEEEKEEEEEEEDTTTTTTTSLSLLKDEILKFLVQNASETSVSASYESKKKKKKRSRYHHHLTLHSIRRTESVVLEVLCEVQPDHYLIPKLVRGLLLARDRGRWRSTHENIFVLLALKKYFDTTQESQKNTTGGAAPDYFCQIWFGNQYTGEVQFKGRETEIKEIKIPMKNIMQHHQKQQPKNDDDKELLLFKRGEGKLFYRIGFEYVPRNLDVLRRPVNRGFEIKRFYSCRSNKRRRRKKKKDEEEEEEEHQVVRYDKNRRIWEFKAGETVKVRLEISNLSQRYHVAIVDPIPACCEIINPIFGESTTGISRKSWSWRMSRWYDHVNYRKESVEIFRSGRLLDGSRSFEYSMKVTSLGNFIVPPARVEEMYNPEIFGRSSLEKVVVVTE